MNKQKWRNVTVLVVVGLIVMAGILFTRVWWPRMSHEPRVTTAPRESGQKTADLPTEEEKVVGPRREPGIPKEKSTVVLATVNGRAITLADLDRELKALTPEYRAVLEEDKEEFLNQLIIRELLLQQAQRQKLEQEEEIQERIAQDKDKRAEILVREITDRMAKDIEISQEELRALYQELKAEIPDKSFQEVKQQLRIYLRQQKTRERLEAVIEELQKTAEITRNQEWLKAQRALRMKNPLDAALQTGKPVLADFGKGLCIPCKEMKPILDELAVEYRGRASILIIEIDEYRALTRRHRVRLIPTQIFFDAAEREVYRHEGFMSKEAIKKKLAEIGVE